MSTVYLEKEMADLKRSHDPLRAEHIGSKKLPEPSRMIQNLERFCVLDTDHFGILQWQSEPEYSRLSRRIARHPATDFFVTIASLHEE